MRKSRFIALVLLISMSAFMQVVPAAAHPADLYVHSLNVTLAADKLSIQWEIKPGPMLVSSIWFEADTNQDEAVSQEEAARWAGARVALLTATLNGAQFPLRMENLQFPSSRDAFQSGAETITIYLSAAWPHDLGDSYELVLHNGVEEQKSVNWYTIAAQDGLKIQTPDQKNSTIRLKIFEPSAQASAQVPLRTDWDSSVLSLSLTEDREEGKPQPPGPRIFWISFLVRRTHRRISCSTWCVKGTFPFHSICLP